MPSRRIAIVLAGMLLVLGGCRKSGPVAFFEPSPVPVPVTGLRIEYPEVQEPLAPEAELALAPGARPWTLDNPEDLPPWDLTLAEAIRLALERGVVLRRLGGTVVAAPGGAQTRLDPALTESNPGSGVEAALAAFDTSFEASVFWNRTDRPINQTFPGLFLPVFGQTSSNFTAALTKPTASGATFVARHHVVYDRNSNPTNRFPSSYDIDYELEWRQPLLRGAGTYFNRIAGPNGQPGALNGVLLARLNTDISLADFEAGVIQLMLDVETAYWDLYFAYRNLENNLAARQSALVTWQALAERLRLGGGSDGVKPHDEAQARSQFYLFEGQVQDALAGRVGIYAREQALRALLGLPAHDGTLIRPATEPSAVPVIFDYPDAVEQSLTSRVELRRQRWQVKRRELELLASRNFLLPTLDAVALYRWRGLGDTLIGPRRDTSLASAYQTLTSGDFQEWQLGVQLNIPMGYRRELSALRNAELALARERALLREQELQITHDLANALRELERAFAVLQTNYNRRAAALVEFESLRARFEVGDREGRVDLLLQAQRRLADANIAYYRSLTDLNLALRDVHREKGTLLQFNLVELAEGPWEMRDYRDADERAAEFELKGGVH